MRPWTPLIALALLVGCPGGPGGGGGEPGDDDDATDPDGYAHSVTVDGPEACGPIESATYPIHDDAGPNDHTIRASTVADYCARYRDYWEGWAGSDYEYETYTLALVDQNGWAACDALSSFLAGFQQAHDAAAPPGSCTLEVYLPVYRGEGTWSTLAEEGGLRIGGGQIWYAGESRIGSILELLGDCSAVGSWADWLALVDGEYVDRWRGLEAWTIEIGEMELAEDGDDWSIQAADMVIEDPATGTQGSLGFDLLAGPCMLDSLPPGY